MILWFYDSMIFLDTTLTQLAGMDLGLPEEQSLYGFPIQSSETTKESKHSFWGSNMKCGGIF